MNDKYINYKALKSEQIEGDDFRVKAQFCEEAKVAVIAPHGGAIEPGTSELTIAIAGEELSFAVFEGMKLQQNRELHITSTNFDEPRCLKIVEKAKTVLAIHGESSSDEVVFIGGLNQSLMTNISNALRKDGYIVQKHSASNLQGRAVNNICNRGMERAGVQLELSRGLRLRFFKSLRADGRKSKTRKFDEFVHAVRQGLKMANLL